MTIGQPSSVVSQFHIYSQAWFMETSKETERLNLAGVNEFVFEDSIQQVLLSDVNWARQTKILALTGNWLTDSLLKWIARCELVDYIEASLVQGTKFEKIAKRYGNLTRLSDQHRPLDGLVHINRLRDRFRIEKMYDEETRQWSTLYQIYRSPTMQKKYTADQVREFTRQSFDRDLKMISDRYPNGKVLFLVRDPRSFINIRLKRARSKTERRSRYFSLMKKWFQVHQMILAQCDKHQICEIIRYEDLVQRPNIILPKVLESFRYQRIYTPRFKFNVTKNTTLDAWNQ